MHRMITTCAGLLVLGFSIAAAQSWRYTGSMATERRMFTATLLDNGKVLVTGGTDRYHKSVRSCELYDVATEQWSAASSMTLPRERHTATLYHDGTVIVIGGNTANNSYNVLTGSVEIYDPSTGTWTDGGAITYPRQNHTATLLPDSTILIVGGYGGRENSFLDRSEIYDPRTRTVRPAASLPVGRMDHQAVGLKNGDVLVAGGRAGGWDGQYFGRVEIYRFATGRWEIIDSMAVSRISGYSLVEFSDGWVLAAGGRTGAMSNSPSAEMLDPETLEWSPVDTMKLPCVWQAGVMLPIDQYLVTGGFIDAVWQNPNIVTATATCEWYDRWRRTWYYAPHLNQERAEHCAIYMRQHVNPELPGDLVLVMGGIIGPDRITETAEILDVTPSSLAVYVQRQTSSIGSDAVALREIQIVGLETGEPYALVRSPGDEHVRIDLVGVDGRVIRTLLKTKLSAGVYRVPIPASELGSGLFFVRRTSPGAVTAQQFVIAR